MKNKFDPTLKEKLESVTRESVLPGKAIVDKLQLKQFEVIADVGCGTGFITLPLAIHLPESEVYAIDVSSEMLDEVNKKIDFNKIKNIKTILAKEREIPLASQSVTYATIVLVLHEVEDPLSVLQEVERIVASKGRVAILEWIKDFSKPRTKLEDEIDADLVEDRIAAEQVLFYMNSLGFNLLTSQELSDLFYLHIYEKLA